jgi:hypothetical protein
VHDDDDDDDDYDDSSDGNVYFHLKWSEMIGHGMDGRGSVYGSDRDVVVRIHTCVTSQVHKASYLVVWVAVSL